MANTTNFGWETPDDTDLVKDGALAMRTLGNAIDASFVDLKGGTTGQILSKNSNTDLDYTWINNDQGDITEVQAGTGISVASGTGPIPVVTNTVATTFDAKGDLVVGTGADTFSKLTAGTNEHRLVADSAQSTGLKYVADTTNYAIAAKGDLLVGTAADTLQALTVGTNGHILVADSTQTTGVKWAAPATTAFSGVSVTKTANQTISNTTDTIVTWDSENFDTDSYHDNSTNNSRITIPSGKGGYYQINLIVSSEVAAAAAARLILEIRKNGSSTILQNESSKSANGGGWSQLSGIVNLAAADYLEVRVWQNSGGNLIMPYGAGYPIWSIAYLGA